MPVKINSEQSWKRAGGKMLLLFANTTWYLAVYWVLVGDRIAPIEVTDNLLQQARGLLEGVFIAPLVVTALWPLVRGALVDIPETRRRRFVVVLSLLVLGDLVIETIERKFPFQGTVFLASLFLVAVVILVRGESVGGGLHDT